MKHSQIVEWFEDYLKYKYHGFFSQIEKESLGNNYLFTVKLNNFKTSLWQAKKYEHKYYLILDVNDIKDIDAKYVFVYNTKTHKFLQNNPEFLNEKSIMLINPLSSLEKTFWIGRHAHKSIIHKLSQYIELHVEKGKNK